MSTAVLTANPCHPARGAAKRLRRLANDDSNELTDRLITYVGGPLVVLLLGAIYLILDFSLDVLAAGQ